jgi:hypothetical protein
MNTLSKAQILNEMAQIKLMERGKLCPYHIKNRSPQAEPYFKLQNWEHGKNRTRHVPPEQVPLVQAALAGYAQYEALSGQLVDLVIQETRQQLDAVSAGVKKKAPTADLLLAQNEEISQLIQRFSSGSPDGSAVQQLEFLVRTAIFKPANELVGLLFQQAVDRVDAAYQAQPGQVRKGRVTIELQGIFGSFPVSRDYYYHAGKHRGHYPADAALGVENGYTPALARLMCLEGADASGYPQAENHLLETGGIAVSARQIQRVVQRVGVAAQAWQEREALPGACDAPIMYGSADGTGVPMRPEELIGRPGKQEDGGAKTRQAYLGCVFTQHGRDAKGHPERDYESTTYVSSFASIDDFGPCLRREAIRRGMGDVPQFVLLIDGAPGLENMGRLNFPGCTQIVDFYHAMEHGGQVLEALLGSKTHPDFKKRHHLWAKELLRSRVHKLIADARQECAGSARAEAVEKELGYFVRNVERMRYATFRRRGYFIGSGVIEAGCKTVIGARCKKSGMFWSESGAENILAFRCINASRRLKEFWAYRLNTHAARNDSLPLAA